jgi:hypothetical protein
MGGDLVNTSSLPGSNVLYITCERDAVVRDALTLGITQHNALRRDLALSPSYPPVQVCSLRSGAVVCFLFLSIKVILRGAFPINNLGIVPLRPGFGGSFLLSEALEFHPQLSLQLSFGRITQAARCGLASGGNEILAPVVKCLGFLWTDSLDMYSLPIRELEPSRLVPVS